MNTSLRQKPPYSPPKGKKESFPYDSAREIPYTAVRKPVGPAATIVRTVSKMPREAEARSAHRWDEGRKFSHPHYGGCHTQENEHNGF